MGEGGFGLSKGAALVLGLVFVGTLAAVWLGVGLGLTSREKEDPTARSYWKVFKHAAVSVDSEICPQQAVKILREGGSAVDAAIVALLCDGVMNTHSMGLGGGFFMTFYNRTEKQAYVIDSREQAPGKATETMFVNKTDASVRGGLAIGVPGEVKGMKVAHDKWGRLPWERLFVDVIEMCEEGFPVRYSLWYAMNSKIDEIYEEENLKEIFVDPSTGELYKEGDIMTRPTLASTLKEIAADPESFYSGELAVKIAQDVQEAGGIIEKEDLENYSISDKEPLQVSLDKMTLYTLRPPSSGAVLALMLNILDEFDFTPSSIKDLDAQVLTYHRVAEAFKFAYAKRSGLGDDEFVNVTELVMNMTSDDYADALKRRIFDHTTHDVNYYEPEFEYTPSDSGTAHMSVMAENGDAVSVTATINTYFGSKVRSKQTGIIFNNEMDDFSSPGSANIFGVPPSETNFIVPGKRPMSSMCPAVIVDENGDVRMIIGASGGTRITTATGWAIMHNLWLGKSINEAIDMKRLHHQLVPEYLSYESGFDKKILVRLSNYKKHEIKALTSGSVVQGIAVGDDGQVYAAADYRKRGQVDGY